jgi:sulfoxide reductase catalytic subunit YedY
VKNRVGKFVTQPWKIEVTGLVDKPLTLDADDLIKRMPLEERVYRFRCVEAWAMTVPWVGFPMSALIQELKPKASAKFLRFTTVMRKDQQPGIGEAPYYSWPYTEGLRMDEAMNPLALFVVGMYGKVLPRQNGAPFRVILPWKYGYKSGKSIVKIEFVDKQPTTFWMKSVPSEYGFYSNVRPDVPHPRWSQAAERVLPTMERRKTLPYNGYERWIEGLYNGKEF